MIHVLYKDQTAFIPGTFNRQYMDIYIGHNGSVFQFLCIDLFYTVAPTFYEICLYEIIHNFFF